MLEDFMYIRGIRYPDLDDQVSDSIMHDIVNDIVSGVIRVGTQKDFLDQM